MTAPLPATAIVTAGRASPYRLAWTALLGIAALKIGESWYQLARAVSENSRHIAADFIVFWTAARADSPYDFEALTAAQHWYMQTVTLRPFAYPPSFLPWVEPFSALPMSLAYAIWTGATALLFILGWARLVRPKIALASMLAPVCLMSVIPGQMIFLLGALIVFALQIIGTRPLLAGLLLGLAATLKPQALVLIPLALVAGRHWRALAGASLSGLLIGLSCLLVQGTGPWLDWASAIPRFSAVLHETGMMHFGVTPASSLARLGIDGAPAAAFLLVTGVLGAATVWVAFRESENPITRIVALNAGTIFVLPYAMPYELALAAPAMMAALLDRRFHPVVCVAAIFMLTGAAQLLGPLVVCAIILWRSSLLEPLDRQQVRIPAAEPLAPRAGGRSYSAA